MVSDWKKEARERLRKQAETGCITHIAQENIPDAEKDRELANCVLNAYQTSDEDLKRIHNQCELTNKNPEKVGECMGAKLTPSPQVQRPPISTEDSILEQVAKCEEEADEIPTVKGRNEFKTWCYAGISVKFSSIRLTSPTPLPLR